ncbi:MAG: 2-amino-4-hydroxy-6-hydroxymethyldihydropteridine diphosphokinase [Rhodopila sp.]
MIFIALGANLPALDGRSPLETLQTAVRCLDQLPHLNVAAVSRWYQTTPVPASAQPDYINAVAALAVDPAVSVDPATLLAQLMAIEAALGRTRSEPNAARRIDLDIIAIDDVIRAAPDPILPHPRAHLRRFVLGPLADIAPDWIHPLLGESAATLLSGLRPDGVAVLK